MNVGVYRQVELLDESSEAHLLCWLNASEIASRKIKVGSIISLKGIEGRKWQVMCIYSTAVKDGDFKRDWKMAGE